MAKEYWIKTSKGTEGPHKRVKLAKLYADFQIGADDLISEDGRSWKKISEVADKLGLSDAKPAPRKKKRRRKRDFSDEDWSSVAKGFEKFSIGVLILMGVFVVSTATILGLFPLFCNEVTKVYYPDATAASLTLGFVIEFFVVAGLLGFVWKQFDELPWFVWLPGAYALFVGFAMSNFEVKVAGLFLLVAFILCQVAGIIGGLVVLVGWIQCYFAPPESKIRGLVVIGVLFLILSNVGVGITAAFNNEKNVSIDMGLFFAVSLLTIVTYLLFVLFLRGIANHFDHDAHRSYVDLFIRRSLIIATGTMLFALLFFAIPAKLAPGLSSLFMLGNILAALYLNFLLLEIVAATHDLLPEE